MQNSLKESVTKSDSSEHQIEEWLLVDKNVTAEIERTDQLSDTISASNSKVHTAASKHTSLAKKPKAHKIDTSLVLDLTPSETQRKRLEENRFEMPTPDDKSGTF